MMLLGRIIAGFSVGLLSGNAPVYTSETAPQNLRGALVMGFQFAVTVRWPSGLADSQVASKLDVNCRELGGLKCKFFSCHGE